MTAQSTLTEFRNDWLPNVSDDGLARLVGLLESGSPLLIHGSFSRACAMGCLATHIAWHHPATQHLNDEAGVQWLTKVAGLNPATSAVIQDWDRCGTAGWELQDALLQACKHEQAEREHPERDEESSGVCFPQAGRDRMLERR